MTERTVQLDHFDTTKREDRAAIKNWLEAIPERLNQPWGANAELISDARQVFQDIEEELKGCDRQARRERYRERETVEWYVREIVKVARAVEIGAESGRAWEAANRALLIGELITELRLKLSWEKFALRGQRHLSFLDRKAQNARRGSRDDRVKAVDELVARGESHRSAFEIIGKAEGVTKHAIKKDYYKKT